MRSRVVVAGRVGVILWFATAAAGQHATADGRLKTGAYPEAYYRKAQPSLARELMMQGMLADRMTPLSLSFIGPTPCVSGVAAGYPCNNVDLVSFLPLADIGGGTGNNDIWGWTDPVDGKEYALVGRSNGTSFVDMSNPEAPVYLGEMPTHTIDSVWRDIKVYRDHAFVVADRADDHGMQVFDLSQLRSVTSPPVSFIPVARYDGFGSSHNLVINEESGFAYAVGSDTCAGGLHLIDIRVPSAPVFAGCFGDDDYTHDAQCVIYHGPDATHDGREICMAFNEDTLTVVDVTDKAAPVMLSRIGYPESRYTHQGWLTEDQRYVLLDDELDESRTGVNTTTYIVDVSDLDAPQFLPFYTAATAAIDHNQYIHQGRVYQSNYRAGLRILDLGCLDQGDLTEVASFDVYPTNDNPRYTGTWSNYPFFASGVIAVNGIESGLFLLRPFLPMRVTPSSTTAVAILNDLRAVRDTSDVALSVLAPVPVGGGFDFYRSDWKDMIGATLLGGPPTTITATYVDVGAVADGIPHYYQVKGIDACGVEAP